jgi:hypothetical protein
MLVASATQDHIAHCKSFFMCPHSAGPEEHWQLIIRASENGERSVTHWSRLSCEAAAQQAPAGGHGCVAFLFIIAATAQMCCLSGRCWCAKASWWHTSAVCNGNRIIWHMHWCPKSIVWCLHEGLNCVLRRGCTCVD